MTRKPFPYLCLLCDNLEHNHEFNFPCNLQFTSNIILNLRLYNAMCITEYFSLVLVLHDLVVDKVGISPFVLYFVNISLWLVIFPCPYHVDVFELFLDGDFLHVVLIMRSLSWIVLEDVGSDKLVGFNADLLIEPYLS